MQQNEPILKLENVTKVYRIGGLIFGSKLVAVDDVSLTVDGGKPAILSIVGESGCGKTTLAKMILRLVDASGGKITFMGRDCANRKVFSNHEFHTLMQPIFQNPFEAFSMRKRVDTYLFSTALSFGIAKNKAQAREAVDQALKSVGLSLDVVEGKYATQFSGGELQRVSIARALITRPKIIVADEPVAMIDASMKMNIVNLFRKIRDEYGISFIYITHDLSTAYYMSDNIATLYRGSLIEMGPARKILDNPAHPYTELLMSSLPRVGAKWKRDVRMPDLEEKEYALTCCKFAPRCAYATQECRVQRPQYRALDHERKVLCFHPLNNE